MNHIKPATKTVLVLAGLLLIALTGIQRALAQRALTPAASASPIHPTFALLDANSENVVTSGGAVSTLKTCGQCHDTDFIASHSFHADLGLSAYAPTTASMDSSDGLFGQWDPLTYRYLSEAGDGRLDLSTPGWLLLNGSRVVGGGPATTSRAGTPLASIPPDAGNPESSILQDGQAVAWDWNQSGTMEMDCFICHLARPNNEARLAAIQRGEFNWAGTATLINTGIVERSTLGTNGYYYNPEAFDSAGELTSDFVTIQDPANSNCAQCHGAVHTDKSPLALTGCSLDNPQTATTGQVISSQKISESGMNLESKSTLTRAWDIHSERGVKCTDCHYSLNNPTYYQENASNRPSHLLFDPRRLDIGDYLKQPDHNFARGQSAQYNVAPQLKGTMRRCDSCHDAPKAHADWLPNVDTHMKNVACETCHIPQTYAPAIQSYDWTVLTPNGEPVRVCRGVDGNPNDIDSLVTGFLPAVLDRTNTDGSRLLAPYNLITTYYWVYDDANGKRPVRLVDLEAAYLQNGSYKSGIVSVFDTNGNGSLEQNELRIDSDAKQKAVAAQLAALGLENPRIEGTVQPYSLNHDVADGGHALSTCTACHSDNSRLNGPVKLADYAPNSVLPVFAKDNNVVSSGQVYEGADGALYYRAAPSADKLYVFGNSRVNWIDWLGGLFFAAVVLGVAGHGTLRYVSGRQPARRPSAQMRLERVYMYEAYRRFWHWLQTLAIVILLLTGLVIHRPDLFGLFSFRYMVTIHNVVAALLALNAALSLFYHLTTGKIHQFIPRPYGFFDDAIEQSKYYLRGIFTGQGHPFAKTPETRMNPLQQMTYFGILNVLLPLQMLTGILMWGVQKWPQLAAALGGLPLLAPFHTFVAWVFAAFIIGHVYLTTTGATPLEAMRGMITGWEDVTVHEKKELKGRKK
jgi:thiosulfate reductase cytochrome b subunit/mono/diheme cytochrome c family protein